MAQRAVLVEEGKRDQEGRHRIGDLQLRPKRTVGRHPQIRKERAFQAEEAVERRPGNWKQTESHSLRLPETSGSIWKTG